MLLENRIAIVTGGARGIGKGIALKFAEEGCSIVIADLLMKEANETLGEISKMGREGAVIQCDVTDSHQVQNMVDQVIKRFGRVDILVNDAGKGAIPNSVVDVPEEEWDAIIAVNLKGVFLCCKAVVPHMKAQKYGKIVNISSGAAESPGTPMVHYNASKAGVLNMTRDMGVELAPFNICVNAILPGMVRTDLWKTAIPPGADEDEFFTNLGKKLIPMQRLVTPEDIAGVAVFLASDLSRYVTADRISAGGGLPYKYDF